MRRYEYIEERQHQEIIDQQRASRMRQTAGSGSKLSILIYDMKRLIDSVRGHWDDLIPSICADEVALESEEESQCWNGTETVS